MNLKSLKKSIILNYNAPIRRGLISANRVRASLGFGPIGIGFILANDVSDTRSVRPMKSLVQQRLLGFEVTVVSRSIVLALELISSFEFLLF